MGQSEGGQKSSVDRANDFIDKSRSAYANAKRLRNAYRAIKRVRAAATVVQVAIATSEIWVPALIIGVIVFLIIITVVVVLGGGDKAGSGAGSGDSLCTGTCQASACSGTDIPDTNATCEISTDICCIPQPPPGTQPPLKFYCQYDLWNTRSCNIDVYGCVPTSLAMIMSSFGSSYTPIKVATSVIDPSYNHYIGCMDPGTSYDGSMAGVTWAKSQGFTAGPQLVKTLSTTANLTIFKQYLSSGYFIFAGAFMPFKAHSYNNQIKVDGHAVVIYDVNPATGTVYYYDPTWCAGGTSNSPIPQAMNVSQFQTWYYAIPIKR